VNIRKIHQLRSACSENQLAAKCLFRLPTNCEMLFLKIHQVQCIYTAIGGFSDQVLCSWLVIGLSTLHLEDCPKKHSAVSGFFEQALRCWWIFIRRGRVSSKVEGKKVTYTFLPNFTQLCGRKIFINVIGLKCLNHIWFKIRLSTRPRLGYGLGTIKLKIL